jgi:hypothetical protein
VGHADDADVWIGEDDRDTVGCSDAQRDSRCRRHQRIARRWLVCDPVDDTHVGSMHLPHHDEVDDAERGRDQPPVVGAVRPAEVEAVEGRDRHASVSVGEGDVDDACRASDALSGCEHVDW